MDIRKIANEFGDFDHLNKCYTFNESGRYSIQAFADAIIDAAIYAAANQRGPAAGFNGVSMNHGIDKAIDAIRALKSKL